MPECPEGCTCGRHGGRAKCSEGCVCKRCYENNHRRVLRKRGKARENVCVNCWETAKEWAHIHDTDPKVPENYQPMCVGCHRAYDGWDAMISNVKKAYWATVPPEERNMNPDTRRKNSEAQKVRWAAMTPDRRQQVVRNAAAGRARNKGKAGNDI